MVGSVDVGGTTTVDPNVANLQWAILCRGGCVLRERGGGKWPVA